MRDAGGGGGGGEGGGLWGWAAGWVGRGREKEGEEIVHMPTGE